MYKVSGEASNKLQMVTPMTSLLKLSVGFAQQQQPEGFPLPSGAVKWHLAFQPQRFPSIPVPINQGLSVFFLLWQM